MNTRVKEIIEGLEVELKELSNYIYDNAELGMKEHKSSKAHIDILEKHGFEVEDNYLGFETAFKAVYDSKKEGPTVAYLVEYDALPGIGHGCGHNMLGTTSTGSGIALSKLIDELGGKIYVFGTPAEETLGLKVDMVNKGAFDDVDIAMMAHPNATNVESGTSLAILPIEFRFKGKPAHASSGPQNGINALDACIQTFNGINAMREHILDSSRIHGIITEGGVAANVVPEYCVAQFYVRTPVHGYMDVLKERVINCAKAGALATGAELEIVYFENPYDALLTNEKLSEIYNKYAKEAGFTNIVPQGHPGGSVDIGNVSQVCPSIHPYFQICEDGENIPAHTKEFAESTLTDTAYEGMKKAIYALTMSGLEVIEDRELLEDIKKEFKEAKGLN